MLRVFACFGCAVFAGCSRLCSGPSQRTPQGSLPRTPPQQVAETTPGFCKTFPSPPRGSRSRMAPRCDPDLPRLYLHSNRPRMPPRFGQHLTGTLQLYPRNPPKGNRPRLAPGIRLDSPRTLQHLPKDSSRQSSMNAPQNLVGPSRGLYQTSQALPQDVTQGCPQDLPNISQALCRPSPRSSHGNRPRMPQHVTETSRDST